MSAAFKNAVNKYLSARNLKPGTRSEYLTTVSKWEKWNGGVSIGRLDKSTIRDSLSWIYDNAVEQGGSNPGRTANKARTHLRALVLRAWENDLIEVPPHFPKPVPHREVAGRHYLTKWEINALRFATHQMTRPKGWQEPMPDRTTLEGRFGSVFQLWSRFRNGLGC